MISEFTLQATIWTFIVYFLTGLSITNGGWHFFVYYLVIILTVLNGASMVRFFSFFAPSKEKAGMFTGISVTVYVVETLWVIVNISRSFKVSLVMSLFPAMVLSG